MLNTAKYTNAKYTNEMVFFKLTQIFALQLQGTLIFIYSWEKMHKHQAA